ncbi:MAG: phosphodiester glycosidase family protein [Acidobacteriota bacterium]|nr:MAG: hypothetical protein DIU54_02715 [Acidobacteriota bacterium]
MKLLRRLTLVVGTVVWLAGCGPAGDEGWLGAPDEVADGVAFFRTNDPSLVADAGPIAVFLVRVDPARARLASVLSRGTVLDAEAVSDIARRHNAAAAINGGFFNRANGEPIGLLKVDGMLVSDSSITRGVVIIHSPPGGPVSLEFDRLAAKLSLHFDTDDGRVMVPIDGVDTTRARGRLMLYSPAYYRDTDTAPTGTEWVLDGDPLQVRAVRVGAGRTPIPPRGAVLSYGGTELPPLLAALQPGTEVEITTSWRSLFGVPDEDLERARHIVAGAGLLRRDAVPIDDWNDEGLDRDSFVDARHPRTMIGRDRHGMIWLGAIDGRQPDYSIGMTFEDLQRLADRLELTDALNLDGGGSTTMVIRGQVVNRPSDPTGVRPVGDALIVTPR